MKKTILSIFILLIISVIACQPVKKEVVTKLPETKVETTGEAVVDAVGDGLNNVDSVDKDLSAEQLGDLDSGFQDVQNI